MALPGSNGRLVGIAFPEVPMTVWDQYNAARRWLAEELNGGGTTPEYGYQRVRAFLVLMERLFSKKEEPSAVTPPTLEHDWLAVD